MIRTSTRLDRLVVAAFMTVTLGAYGLSTGAIAVEDPIPLIDVVVKKTPPGNGVTAKTDSRGRIVFKNLPPGTYVVTDSKGHKKTFIHPGGPVKWQFVDVDTNGNPVWTLMDDSNPL